MPIPSPSLRPRSLRSSCPSCPSASMASMAAAVLLAAALFWTGVSCSDDSSLTDPEFAEAFLIYSGEIETTDCNCIEEIDIYLDGEFLERYDTVVDGDTIFWALEEELDDDHGEIVLTVRIRELSRSSATVDIESEAVIVDLFDDTDTFDLDARDEVVVEGDEISWTIEY